MTTRRGYLAAVGALGTPAVGGCLGGDSNGTGGGDDTGRTEAGDDASGVLTPSGEGSISLSSPAFDDGGAIPTRFSCDGEGVSPRLDVSGVPNDAASLALVVDDPDAPRETPFVHWLLWGVPPDTTTIPEGVSRGDHVGSLDGATQGTNSAGNVGYNGPCPPADDGPHTYRFMLYAVDSSIGLDPGVERPAVDDAIRGRVAAETTLTGTFDRS